MTTEIERTTEFDATGLHPVEGGRSPTDGVSGCVAFSGEEPGSIGDSVPNAGNANGWIQAGTGEPRNELPATRSRNAAVVNAPLSQSQLSANRIISAHEGRAAKTARKRQIWQAWERLSKEGMSQAEAAKEIGIGEVTLWRLIRRFEKEGEAAFEPKTETCGRKPAVQPLAEELQCVKEIYIRLNESRVRGKGLGSSKVTAYRLAAKSEDPRISDVFRGQVLKRKHKNVPPSWLRLLDLPASVLDRARDKSSTMRSHISTPRGMTYVNAAGAEVPLMAGSIFESDDGTVNFPVWVPWPYGGDKCSDKYGCKVGRFQLLPVVDRRTRFCPFFHFVIRAKSSYRGEDVVALFGAAFAEVGLPEALCLERGSWESKIVRSALEMSGVRVVRAWEPKQKNAVENFFDRLWTPLSLLPGDVGRRRGENVENTDLVIACGDGRRDPREHFLSVEQAVQGIGSAVTFINGEPVESKSWGRWIPQQMFEEQTEGGSRMPKLGPELKLFFSREQRLWTVKGGCVGGRVATPQLEFPVYFQPEALWEFEGCAVRAFFDPFAEEVKGTLVMEEENWRGYRKGYVIARDCPALELPPQAVLSSDWTRSEELERGIAARKAMAKAVRTEAWSWRGGRRSEARDGMGNVTVKTKAPRTNDQAPVNDQGSNTGVETKSRTYGPEAIKPAAIGEDGGRWEPGKEVEKSRTVMVRKGVVPASRGPSAEEMDKQRNRLARQAEIAARLRQLRGEE